MRLNWAMVIAVLCLLVVVVAVAYAAGQAKVTVPEVIRAERFELVDAEGKVWGVFGSEVFGPGPKLSLRDELGKERLTLFVHGTAYGGRGYVGVHLWDGAEDTPARLMLRVESGGGTSVWLRDKGGKLRAVLGTTDLETVKTGTTTKTAESSLVLFDKDEKVLWKAP